MNKMLILLVMGSCLYSVSVYSSFEGIKKENVRIGNTIIMHEMPKDEYQQICQEDDLQEYEQHVCDHIKPPKISASMAFFSEIGGRMLIEFIMMREALRRYFVSLKAMISKWLGLVVTQ